ncbi:DNA topoisomerase IB [Flavobacterium sp. GT3R68]|uniref:DNA topoisomerase IB n=1 Tax=Flavobacterium sp. GT3R68 TaxID=2594437 RepID=UPI000F89AADA|nr:DNA topoisomerase IB [Flavobacterium sp. GT3R68]RTY94920.1 DNA topoisomerase IB [Flavobacterium sp. GSN2]TRW91724.1 DNA topoisomerase IB [Flavobacterium sp. GT3R68]
MNRLQSKLEKIGRNHITTAKAAGLRYVANSNNGFSRERTKWGFKFVDENKNDLQEEYLERIQKLVIPPAWENVWISPYDNGHLQATGIDTKGRKQYLYHPSWNTIRNQSKFYRLLDFAKVLPSIRKQVEKDLHKKGLPYTKVVALVVKLLEITNIRVGNDAYKKLYGSFGLTTLQDKHVKAEKSSIYFDFVGKKGIKHRISLKSKRLVNLVKKCKDIPGQDLFQYYDDNGESHAIGSADINNYLKEVTNQDFTAKDFRVWAGSVNAFCAFLDSKCPENITECKRKIVEVLDTVSSKLGNTRTVCKKYYIHPTVINSYEKGSIWNYKSKSKSKSTKFSPEEFALIKLLEKETVSGFSS